MVNELCFIFFSLQKCGADVCSIVTSKEETWGSPVDRQGWQSRLIITCEYFDDVKRGKVSSISGTDLLEGCYTPFQQGLLQIKL
jgi:hypothetical protein